MGGFQKVLCHGTSHQGAPSTSKGSFSVSCTTRHIHPAPVTRKWLPLVPQRAASQQVLPRQHFGERLRPAGHSCALSNKIWISVVAGEREAVAPSHRFVPSLGALIQPKRFPICVIPVFFSFSYHLVINPILVNNP